MSDWLDLTDRNNIKPLPNYAGSGAPGVGNDSSEGYAIGSRWLDTAAEKEYICKDASVGAADWFEVSGVGGTSTFVGLTDTPGSLTDGQYLTVQSNALIETDPPSIGNILSGTYAELSLAIADKTLVVTTDSVGVMSDFDMAGVQFDDVPKWDGSKFTMQPDVTAPVLERVVDLGGRYACVTTGAGVWAGINHSYAWIGDANAQTSYGSGADPTVNLYYGGAFPMAPSDGTVTKTRIHWQCTSGTATGEIGFYKISTTDGQGSGGLTLTQIGTNVVINNPTLSVVHHDFETGIGLSVAAGDSFGLFIKHDVDPGVVTCRGHIVMEY